MGYGQASVVNQIGRVRSALSLRNAFKVSDNNDTNVEGLLDFLDELRLCNGINTIRLINDMETAGDWVESTNGTFDVAVNSSGKVGTNAQKFTATAAGNGTQNIQTAIIDGGDGIPAGNVDGLVHRTGSMDWGDSDFVGGWWKADTAADFGTAGELLFNIKNNGAWGTGVNFPATSGTGTNWERFEIDITSFERGKVEAIRIELPAGAAAGEDVSIDELVRYKFGTGYGPVMGQCQPFIVTSGVTVARGQFGTLTGTGTVGIAAAAAGLNIPGPCAVGGTGGIDYDVAWFQVSGFGFWPVGTTVTEDQTLIWGANHLLLSDAGTTSIDNRIIGRMPDGTTVTERAVVLVEWGRFVNDDAGLAS